MPKLAQLDYGRETRPDPAALGALEEDTDVSAWEAFPEAPGAVTADWATGVVPASPGDDLEATDVDVAVAAPGVPALTSGDVDVAIQKMSGGSVVDEGASFTNVSASEEYRPIARYSHITLGYREVLGTTATVASASFTPEIVDNQGSAVLRSDGLAALTGTHHIAFRAKRLTPNGTGGSLRMINTPNMRINIGSSNVFQVQYQNATLKESPFNWLQNETVSVLISAFPGNNGTGTTCTVAWKIDSNAQQSASYTDDVGDFAGTGGDSYFFGRVNTAGVMDVEIEEYFGIWEGGSPAWSDFFESDGSVKEWSADPSRGVSGMTAALLIGGVSAFNDPDTSNLGSWPGTTGNLRADGAVAFQSA